MMCRPPLVSGKHRFQDFLRQCEEDMIFLLHQVNGKLAVIEISRLAQQACCGMPRFSYIPEDGLGRVYQQNHFMLREDELTEEMYWEEETKR